MSAEKSKIIIKGRDRTDDVKSYYSKDNKISITFNDGSTFHYNAENVEIINSVLSDKATHNCFNYLKNITELVGLKDSSGNNILHKHYSKIDFIAESSPLAAFLSGKFSAVEASPPPLTIYPFGFNLSQKKAIDNALTNQLSIIEGPPGTGKTQSILNIIANIVIQGKSVAVVSNNNSATANVFEKLKKYELDFISANLGSTENKQNFIEGQTPLPNLSALELSLAEEVKTKQVLETLAAQLDDMLLKRNELSSIKKKFEAIVLEYQHFNEYCSFSDEFVDTYLKLITADKSLELWLLCEKYLRKNKKPNFFAKIINGYRFGIKTKEFYKLSYEEMINLTQKRYYTTKIHELNYRVQNLQNEIEKFHFNEKMAESSNLSLKLLKHYLSQKYENLDNKSFEIDDLWKNPKKFLQQYPVILSTTYSLISSLKNITYDYVIIDEASQVDIATGALALYCAKNIVVVGDLKQLPNIVDSEAEKSTDILFKKFGLAEAYRYKNHSILLSCAKLFPQVPRVLLREHYRCHPKIIEFCNQKFYNNQLIVLTEEKSSQRQPLIFYKTVSGNHDRNHVNQRQIDVIAKEIIPQQRLENCDLGIVTPYRNQTNALQKTFAGTQIVADTVDKFQGRENEVIILCTVDNKISTFTDNPNRLNVAVSRAIDQLILVSSDEDTGDTNIGDLENYIKYNNLEIIKSEVYSVFDYLYKDYYYKRQEFLRKKGRVSKFDSENLMSVLINEVLSLDKFSKFNVANFVPLKMLLRDTSMLEENEKKYAGNMLTHVDFLIFDKLSKLPVLVIEVDGFAYHKEGSRQYQRDILKNNVLKKYSIPLLRFKTNGSNEKEQLISQLEDIL
ncbi:MAG: DUF2726 domain-containing protein [Alphaproteobacteria bacterium]|jgi:superfamily I DNA and/or RNA helicase|nr:DUF2726 domain-containing protein [Alphaproteobacteria bacterium]